MRRDTQVIVRALLRSFDNNGPVNYCSHANYGDVSFFFFLSGIVEGQGEVSARKVCQKSCAAGSLSISISLLSFWHLALLSILRSRIAEGKRNQFLSGSTSATGIGFLVVIVTVSHSNEERRRVLVPQLTLA